MIVMMMIIIIVTILVIIVIVLIVDNVPAKVSTAILETEHFEYDCNVALY
jgi:hypothetical protein